MTEYIAWTTSLLRIAENEDYPAVIEWAGKTIEHNRVNTNHSSYILMPHKDDISKILVNTEGESLERIYIQGNTFALPFHYLLGLIGDYKTAFNTYDAIDDEQFIFYNPKNTRRLVGIDSWVQKDQQQTKQTQMVFRNISFYFNRNKIPVHYRDGWHFVNPEKLNNIR